MNAKRSLALAAVLLPTLVGCAAESGDDAAPETEAAEVTGTTASALAAAAPVSPAGWMAITPGLGAKKLNEVWIPGTHDSATYDLLSTYDRPTNDMFAPDAEDFVRAASLFGATLPWSEAQSKTVLQQLNDGIRYVDLRPCVEKNGTIRNCHGHYGPEMSTVLADIATFAKAHPKEILVVSMGSFKGFDADDHTRLVADLKAKLGTSLLDFSPGKLTASSTFSAMWATGRSVAVLYNSDTGRDASFLGKASAVSSWKTALWDRDPLLGALDTAMTTRPADKLLVLAGAATPDESGDLYKKGANLAANYPRSLEELAEKTNPVVLGKFAGTWSTRTGAIVSVDYYEKTCLVQVMQKLNGVPGASTAGCDFNDTTWGHWGAPYGRGWGSAFQCGANEENSGGSCYPRCAPGYSGAATMCLGSCPDSYRDDGLLCTRDLKVIIKRGKCPSGYKNDGLFCRRPPSTISKPRYDRGLGHAPSSCGAGTEQSGLLCYPACKTGFEGEGPMCNPVK